MTRFSEMTGIFYDVFFLVLPNEIRGVNLYVPLLMLFSQWKNVRKNSDQSENDVCSHRFSHHLQVLTVSNSKTISANKHHSWCLNQSLHLHLLSSNDNPSENKDHSIILNLVFWYCPQTIIRLRTKVQSNHKHSINRFSSSGCLFAVLKR